MSHLVWIMVYILHIYIYKQSLKLILDKMVYTYNYYTYIIHIYIYILSHYMSREAEDLGT